jgi:hypothetical protein
MKNLAWSHRRLWCTFCTIFIVIGAALPVFAARNAAINGVTLVDCNLVINVTVEDGGTYFLQIWDDHILIDGQTFTATTSETLDVIYSIKRPAGRLVPGIAVVIADGPSAGDTEFDTLDFISYPDDFADACAARYTAAPICLNVPEGSVVGELTSPTEVFWEPGKISPGISLQPTPDNKTYWVIGVDATGKYYKIVLSCQYLWVPVGVMAPAYGDPVWNGTPLPTREVE